MAYLTLGELTVPVSWIAFFSAIIYSDFRSKHKDKGTAKVISRLFWLYLIVWKFSYIVFSWESFRQAPMSLLYFDGGLKGHLAALLMGALLVIKERHALEWMGAWQYWARFVAFHQLIVFAFTGQWLLAAIWLGVLLVVEWKFQDWILLVQWMLLLWMGGWLDAMLLSHGMVIVSVIWKRKQVQQIALMLVLSLIAMTLADIRSAPAVTQREPIDLMSTLNERYLLSVQEQELTIVNFFATWCPPCQAEMPHLQRFSEDLPDEVALIGVNLNDRDDGSQALEAFMEKYEVTYPILLDESDQFGKGYQVVSIPTTVLLDADGQELQRIVGPVSEQVLRDMIERYQ